MSAPSPTPPGAVPGGTPGSGTIADAAAPDPTTAAGAAAAAPAGSGPVNRLDSLTGLRFFGALAVVLLHTIANRSLNDPIVSIPGLSRVAELGYLGVTFFFMLSGFVLTWNARARDTKRAFYRRRFARIYPLHLATALAALAATLATGGLVTAGTTIACLLLVQTWVNDPSVYFGLNGVSWSLSCEMFFYLVFPFVVPSLLRWGRRGRAVFAGSVGAAMLLVAVLVLTIPGWLPVGRYIWISPLFNIGLFFIGMTLALVVKDARLHVPGGLPTATLAVAVALMLITVLSPNGPLSRPMATVIVAPAIALLLVAAATRDASGRRSWLGSRPMVSLGEWSFALYLTHPLVRGAFLLAGAENVGGVRGILLEIGFVLTAIAVSGLAFILYERPLEKWLRPRSRPKPAPTSAAVATA
ncbi:acyltransferase family protein [Nakamurella sp. YIM 132087]|uniref:Acyltransferase family protein n=1 Tax=Nakamurella alba TaxID=2665158 RepID=A0A7K1FLE4_9ACTN|nr:acyltransferase [Nakamurella alba]MTD13704.1 acyltransferase family protein [Nakamurella alba]